MLSSVKRAIINFHNNKKACNKLQAFLLPITIHIYEIDTILPSWQIPP